MPNEGVRARINTEIIVVTCRPPTSHHPSTLLLRCQFHSPYVVRPQTTDHFLSSNREVETPTTHSSHTVADAKRVVCDVIRLPHRPTTDSPVCQDSNFLESEAEFPDLVEGR